MKSIVFLDLDETLWRNEIIPDSALKAIGQAVANGHLVFANTGRSRDAAWRGLEGLPLSGAVYSAGSEIWKDGKRIYFEPLGAAKTHRLMDALLPMDIGISVEGSDSTHLNQKSRDDLFNMLPKHDKVSFRFDLLPDLDAMEEKDYADAMKLSLIGIEPGSIDDLLAQEDMVFTAFGIQDGKDKIDGEITQKSMDKGTAFQTIKDLLHQDFRTIAIGDSENDLPMFETADLAVAMGNGVPRAKEAADYVTAPIDEDGVYKAFEYAGLLDPQAE